MIVPFPAVPAHVIYDTDLTDVEWAALRPEVEIRTKTSSVRTVDLQTVSHALLYKLSDSGQFTAWLQQHDILSTMGRSFRLSCDVAIFNQIQITTPCHNLRHQPPPLHRG